MIRFCLVEASERGKGDALSGLLEDVHRSTSQITTRMPFVPMSRSSRRTVTEAIEAPKKVDTRRFTVGLTLRSMYSMTTGRFWRILACSTEYMCY